MRVLWLTGVVLVAGLPSGLEAQASDRKVAVADFLDLEQVGDPQISPDGKTIVFSRSHVDKMTDSWASEIWVMDADGGRPRFLTKGGGPVWSPDGTRIAYLAAADSPKGAQIFVRWMDAEGATSQVTRVTETPRSIHWSPNGEWLSFGMFVAKANPWPIEMPAPPAGAKWTAPPRVVDQLHFRLDRVGFKETGFVHLFVVPAEGGTPRQLTSGDWSVGAAFDGIAFAANHAWTPDGRTILFDGLAEARADTTFKESYLYSVDVASGAMRRLITERGFWAGPVVSPDGKLVAFGGREHLPVVWQTSDLQVMNIDGTGRRNLSRGIDREVGGFVGATPHWARDGSGLYASVQDQGAENVLFFPLAGAPRPVTTGSQMLSLVSMSNAGDMVGVASSFKAPAEVVRISVDRRGRATTTAITDVNADFLAGRTLADVEEIWYPSSGGARIQGWIVKPPDFDPARKYPMLLEIHGGPQGMYGVGFDPMWQVFAAQGYVVLYTNPRGSTGYGDAFVRAIEKRYPGPDYEDLMAGVDSLIGRGYVDANRLYVAGCSGGGALSSWVVGHTKRFAAAAVRCPVTNWITMAGNADVPYFAHSFFDKPFWEDPMAWFRQSSLAYVGNVSTPTLLMTGVQDMRTPMSQTEDFYAALKMRGVPTKILRFENEWHGTESTPSNWMRTMLYMMSWFQQYTRPAA
ncbi:MAG: prolyl oligopeptidase family serine peptidase [Gemmatimonadales bacterium]